MTGNSHDIETLKQSSDDMLGTLQAQRDTANNQIVHLDAALKAARREIEKSAARINELEQRLSDSMSKKRDAMIIDAEPIAANGDDPMLPLPNGHAEAMAH